MPNSAVTQASMSAGVVHPNVFAMRGLIAASALSRVTTWAICTFDVYQGVAGACATMTGVVTTGLGVLIAALLGHLKAIGRC